MKLKKELQKVDVNIKNKSKDNVEKEIIQSETTPEVINKERRYILLGLFSMFTLARGLTALTSKESKPVGKMGGMFIVNLALRLLSLIRFILKA